MLNNDELIKLVLTSFELERTNAVEKAEALLHKDFKVTEMSEWYDGTIFKSLGGDEVRSLMKKAFVIQGREYDFKNVVANEKDQTVLVEFVESYPDPKSGKAYRTPQVAVCEIKDGKIFRTRHYNDPRLSYKYLSKEKVDEAFN